MSDLRAWLAERGVNVIVSSACPPDCAFLMSDGLHVPPVEPPEGTAEREEWEAAVRRIVAIHW